MASWIRDTFLDLINVFSDPPPSSPIQHPKRQREEEVYRHNIPQRYSDETYQTAPYSGSKSYITRPCSKKRVRKDSAVSIKAKRSLEELRGHLSSDVETHGPLNRLEVQLAKTNRIRLTGIAQNSTLKGLQQRPKSKEPVLINTDLQDLPAGADLPGRIEVYPDPRVSATTIKPKVTVVEEPWDQNMTNNQKWATRPNKKAREWVERYPDSTTAKGRIQRDVGEPEYVLRDIEIRDSLWHLMDLMERFTKKYFSFTLPTTKQTTLLQQCFRALNAETAKVIGNVASGGPAGVQGWQDLFIDEQKRRPLVSAIIGNVLVEQVFQHLFFGGDIQDIVALTTMQKQYRNEDGKLTLQSTPTNKFKPP